MTAPTLSLRTLNRTLLERQLLREPSPLTPLAAAEHLVGLQAQLPSSPYIALRARLARFTPEDLATAVEDRRAVRIVLMRGTIHLVSADDALALRAVVQPVLDRELFGNRTWARGLEGVDLAPVLALGRALVDERPRTLAELRDAMAERWPDADVRSLAYAVRNLLPTLQVPPRGLWTRSGSARLTTLEAWTGRTPAAAADPAPALRRYLGAFGPASVADMQAWSRLSGLRAVVEAMRPTLRTYRDERGRELFDLPDLPLADADLPAPVRFLPDYDNALLAHADRSRIVPALDWPALGDNVTAPIILVDGFAAGIWRLRKPASKGQSTVLAVQALVPVTPATRKALEEEATALAAFLATATPGAPAATVHVTAAT